MSRIKDYIIQEEEFARIERDQATWPDETGEPWKTETSVSDKLLIQRQWLIHLREQRLEVLGSPRTVETLVRLKALDNEIARTERYITALETWRDVAEGKRPGLNLPDPYQVEAAMFREAERRGGV